MTGLRRLSAFLPVSILSMAAFALGDESRPAFDGFHARMALEYGHLWSGEYRRANAARTAATRLDFVPLNRNIITLAYQSETGGNWNYHAGFKGILW